VLKAAQLARAWGAEVELFHAIDTPIYLDALGLADIDLATIQREMRAHSVQTLERIAARLRKHRIKVSVAAEHDFPIDEAIVRRARRIKADLIVAECHAGRRLAPWLLHLTDWQLLQLSPLPVLLVKNARPYRHPVVLAGIDPMHTFAKPARLDDEILSSGFAVQRALRGTLHAMHAYLPLPMYIASGGAAYSVDQIEKTARDNALKGFARALRKTRIPRARRHLIEQHPLEAIPDTARKIGSAIVVMGAVSRSGLKRVFIGNTAERVLNALTCDVLVVKPQQFHSPVQRGRRGVRLMAVTSPLP
jgi:universal stress protein E